MTSYTCPICDSGNVQGVLDLDDIPVHCNVLHTTHEQAVTTPRGNIRLCFCRECGHAFNAAFDEGLLSYSQAYENSLHYSPRFREYAEELAQELIERYDVIDKDVIEIGCGSGDFLKLFCRLGKNRGIGFDASFGDREFSDEHVRIIPARYHGKHKELTADFICCRHVLEHVANPKALASDLKAATGSRTQAGIYVEVPNFLWILEHLRIWDMIYEHYSYFSPASLRRFFVSGGFAISRLVERFERQFLGIELALGGNSIPSPESDLPAISRLIQKFSGKAEDEICRWEEVLDRISSEDKRIVLWGAGSKGVTFLNVLKSHTTGIPFVVDVNPRKHGMYVAGSGQQIIAPHLLKNYQPECIIVMNQIYKREIEEVIREMGVSAEIILA